MISPPQINNGIINDQIQNIHNNAKFGLQLIPAITHSHLLEFGPMRSNEFRVLRNHTHPPTLKILILHPLIGTTMLVQGWGYNSMNCTSLVVVGSWMLKWRYGCWKEGNWWYEGRARTFWHLPTFCVIIIINALNLGYWGCFITPS